jgi:hypothetical protein
VPFLFEALEIVNNTDNGRHPELTWSIHRHYHDALVIVIFL